MFKKLILIVSCFSCFGSYNYSNVTQLVNLKKIIPTIEIELKYATKDNFTKQQVYYFKICYLLDRVAADFKRSNVCTSIYQQ